MHLAGDTAYSTETGAVTVFTQHSALSTQNSSGQRTFRPPSSRSITRPASSAIAASARAMTFRCNEVIGRTGKGYATRIGFDLDDPMGEIDLRVVWRVRRRLPDRRAHQQGHHIAAHRARRDDGGRFGLPVLRCRLRDDLLHAATSKIVSAEGRDGSGNDGRLCVKGRYGWDYAMHEQRLTKPLIRRKEYYPKGPLSPEVADSQGGKNTRVDYAQVMPAFREATWDEALDLDRVAACSPSRRNTDRGPSPGSAPPSAATRRPISSRS